MPPRGVKPKPAGQAVTRHPLTVSWIEVPDLPFDGEVPALPEREPAWPARALDKWAAWSRMPHCRLWSETEWRFAIDSLEVAERFYAGDRPAATELRNREKQLGTTLDYRRDLRIRYVDPDVQDEAERAAPAEATVAKLDDYRDLYG